MLKDGTLSYYKSQHETSVGCRGAVSLNKAVITVRNGIVVILKQTKYFKIFFFSLSLAKFNKILQFNENIGLIVN